jgi:uncharacterized protein YndB with AHSA1/START domain
MNSDRLEKRIVLKATRERVWNAISDSRSFGAWFGVEFDGPFEEGSWLAGRIVPTTVDPVVATLQEPARGMRFSLLVERVEPMKRFSFRWHPFAVDPGHDYATEPTTLVVFELGDAPDRIALTITESGFDALPIARRKQAFEANETGWAHQTRLIEKYLVREE